MERTAFQKSMDGFSLKFSVLLETLQTHGHRIHELIDNSGKYQEACTSLHSQWLFLEYRAEQLDDTLGSLEGDWPMDGVEPFNAVLNSFSAAGHTIIGDAFEAFGLELPYINTVRAAHTMVEFAEGLHGELGRIIAADYASRRTPAPAALPAGEG